MQGPWVVAETGTYPETNHWLGIYSDHGTRQVAKIEGWGDEAADVARLIGAAPDLLGAVEMIRDADDDCKRDGLPTLPPAARAAIDAALTKVER